MGQDITLKASDGFELHGYRADPEGTPRGGIVVIMEIFGVNETHPRPVRPLCRCRLSGGRPPRFMTGSKRASKWATRPTTSPKAAT